MAVYNEWVFECRPYEDTIKRDLGLWLSRSWWGGARFN